MNNLNLITAQWLLINLAKKIYHLGTIKSKANTFKMGNVRNCLNRSLALGRLNICSITDMLYLRQKKTVQELMRSFAYTKEILQAA